MICLSAHIVWVLKYDLSKEYIHIIFGSININLTGGFCNALGKPLLLHQTAPDFAQGAYQGIC